MKEPDFKGARAYALTRLAAELPAELSYHSISHTTEEVAVAAERLAAMEDLPEEEVLLLKTAAYFHDLGFIHQVDGSGHEQIGVGIAREVLPCYGYKPEQIEKISRMIMATRLPQSPKTLAERILVDADLSSLGSENFLKRSLELKAELEVKGQTFTDEEWCHGQLKFLTEHEYFTEAGKKLFGGVKERNIAMIRRMIEAREERIGAQEPDDQGESQETLKNHSVNHPT